MSDEPTPGADRYAEYRRGRIPLEQRAELESALGKNQNKMWALVTFYFVAGAVLAVLAVQELQQPGFVVGIHESAVIYLCLLAAGLVMGPFWIARSVHRYRDAVRELTADTVAQAEGALAWRRGSYGAFVEGRRLWCVADAFKELVPGPYRLFYLPQSRLLVAAEWVGAPIPRYDILLKVARANRFKVFALAANRDGRRLGADVTSWFSRVAWPVASVLFIIVMPRLIAWAIGDLPPDLTRADLSSAALTYLLGGLVAVPLIVLISLWSQSPNERPGKAASTTGHVDRASFVQHGRPVHTFEVNGMLFHVSEAGYDALDERLTYRVYYTPRTKRLLNMEPIG